MRPCCGRVVRVAPMGKPAADSTPAPAAAACCRPLLRLLVVLLLPPPSLAPPANPKTDTPAPLFDRSHPDAAPTPHSNKVFSAEQHTSIATCSTHHERESCEGAACYWSVDSRKCYVKYVPGSEGTYAQNYQDWWVHKLAEANGWGKDGTFLDLGAHSGLWCSNTKLLEETLSWRGVCVEPFPENGPTKGSFLDRSCALVPRALTGEHNGQVVRMHTPTDAQSMQLKLNQLQQPGNGGGGEGGMEATTIAINTLLSCPATLPLDSKGQDGAAVDICAGKQWARAGLQAGLPKFIHFVSMDVEGLELEVLRFWPFDDVRVGAWVIEHNNEEEKRKGVTSLLAKHGYTRYDVENAGVDDYFVDPKYWKGDHLKTKPWREHPHGTFGC